jgi:hypothetical protein
MLRSNPINSPVYSYRSINRARMCWSSLNHTESETFVVQKTNPILHKFNTSHTNSETMKRRYTNDNKLFGNKYQAVE